jgi:DNA replication protein DnaC
MEKPGSVIPALLAKTIPQEPSSRYCKQHEREVPDVVIPIGLRKKILEGKCPDCTVEIDQRNLLTEKRKQYQAQLESRRRAGVPERYLNACISDFREELPGQKIVGQHLQNFINDGWRESPGLLLLGSVGTAKTLVGAALVNHWLDHRGPNSARFYTVLGLIGRVTAAWKDHSDETDSMAYQRLRDLPLLVVDEVGVQFGSPTEYTIFTEIINQRYNALHPTILIGNLMLTELAAALGERVVDRFRDGGHTLAFTWPSQRGLRPL